MERLLNIIVGSRAGSGLIIDIQVRKTRTEKAFQGIVFIRQNGE